DALGGARGDGAECPPSLTALGRLGAGAGSTRPSRQPIAQPKQTLSAVLLIAEPLFEIRDLAEQPRLSVIVGPLARERLLDIRLPGQLHGAGRFGRHVAQSLEVGG